MQKGYGHIFKTRREELGLTLQQVADRASITRSYLSRLENDDREPTLSKAVALAAALEMPLGELIGERPKRPTIANRKRDTSKIERLLKAALDELQK